MTIISAIKNAFRSGRGQGGSGGLRSEFMRGGRGVTFGGWMPFLRDAKDDVGSSWAAAAARAIDTIHNSGWIAGAIDQAVANTVGIGLRLKAAPEYEQLQMTDQEARDWSRKVEQRFGLWADNKVEFDIEGRMTFGQAQAAVLRSYIAMGEAFAEFPYRLRRNYGSKCRLVSPHRVPVTNSDMLGTQQGIRLDVDNFATGYAVRVKNSIGFEEDRLIPAFDSAWRPRMVHIFDGAIGQLRGITPLVPALRVARQFDQLADATLTAAILQSVFAASIESDMPTEEFLQGLITPAEYQGKSSGVMNLMEAQSGWRENSTINLGINGRVAHLFPGQKLNFHSAEHPNGNYKDFALHLLREISRCLGLTYESTTGDYTGATYSSVRMATSEVFLMTLYRRAVIISPFCQAAYECWLEEEIENGTIEFPGGIQNFLNNRSAACRAIWRGTPKPQADDIKIAKAHEVWRSMGVITDEMIANDLGIDIEDVYVQLAREAEMRKQYKLKEPGAQPQAQTQADPSLEEEPADAGAA